MHLSIIYKTTKRHTVGRLTKTETKLLRHYMAEATNRLYRDLLKREKPAVVQVEVFNDPGCDIEGASLHDSDENHNCIRIQHYLLRRSPSDPEPRFVIAHELVHGVDNIMMIGEYYIVIHSPQVRFAFHEIMFLIYKFRSEGMAQMGAYLMYGELFPEEEDTSGILDSFVKYFERLLKDAIKDPWFTPGNINPFVLYSCDFVLVEAMRALGLISDDVARGYSERTLLQEDRSYLMQTALSMSLSQFIEGIFIAFRGKSSLVDKLFLFCWNLQNRIEKDETTLFTLLAKTRVVKVEEHNRVLEKIVKTQMPDERLGQMVKALHDASEHQTNPVLTRKEMLSNAMDSKIVPEYQTNPGALKMIEQLYEYYLQYKDDPFYKVCAQAASWSLNYYFKRDDLIHDDLLFMGHADDLILLDVTQQMIKREMALDLNFRMNDSGDGLIVILDEDRGDMYIPEWHLLDGKLYPVVEVRLGNLQNLSSLYIPKTVTSIDMKCISVGSSLSSIQVAENHPRYDNRNSCNAIIETATNKLVLGCKATEIPFSVTSIGNYAFRNIPQKELSYPAEVMFFPRIELLIPDEVTEIAPDAFEGFEGSIYFRDPSMIENSGGEVIRI